MWIFCAGMIRSGSTLQFQLTSSIIEHARLGFRVKYAPESNFKTVQEQHMKDSCLKVFKVHVCTPVLEKIAQADGTRVVYSYRDIRDVAVSAMRKFDMSFDALIDAGWLDQAIADYGAWTNMPNVLITRYEQMIFDLNKEVSRISKFLEINLSEDALYNISTRHEFFAQKGIIDALRVRYDRSINDGDIVFDEIELLHHNHLFKGTVDGWRNLLQPSHQRFLTERYCQWLSSLGYSLEY